MRKFLVAVLMLVMLTPSLACAMPVCVEEPQAAAFEQPCTEHSGNQGTGKKDSDGKVTLMKDCMGVDLQVADGSASIKAPDFKKDISFDISFVTYPVTSWTVAVIGNRGPPPNWPKYSETYPSIILTTLRFRE